MQESKKTGHSECGPQTYVGKQQVAPDKRCTGFWELDWAFKKGILKRETWLSNDITTTTASVSTR